MDESFRSSDYMNSYALNFMLNDLSPDLHGLLCEFVNSYVSNVRTERNFETHGRKFFEEAQRNKPKRRNVPPEAASSKALDTLKNDPSALYKLVECDPDILYLRDQLKYLVLGYLLNNPKDIEKYGLDYFGDPRRKPENEHPYRRFGVDGGSDMFDKTMTSTVVHYDKTPEECEQLRNKIRHALLFRSLDDNQMDQVLLAMFRLNVKKGSYVIRQGDEGDYFYVVDGGVFEAFVKDGRGVDQKVSTYKGNGSFGELALLYNMPRVATVRAVTDGALWCLDRDSFRKIVVRTAFEKRKMYESFIAKVPILSHLSDYERQTLADALQPLLYEDGDCIIRQADESAAGMYFVEEGTVIFSYTNANGRASMLHEITEGGYFGELALVEKKPRAVSAYASGRVRLAFIDKDSFERLLGPCHEIMQRDAAKYNEERNLLDSAGTIFTRLDAKKMTRAWVSKWIKSQTIESLKTRLERQLPQFLLHVCNKKPYFLYMKIQNT